MSFLHLIDFIIIIKIHTLNIINNINFELICNKVLILGEIKWKLEYEY